MTTRVQKEGLRTRMRRLRASIPAPDRLTAADVLAEALPRHPLVAPLPPGQVLVPVGHRSEIGTGPLAARLAKAGWSIVRPRSDPERTRLEAVAWPLDAPLVAGHAGIPEPPPDAAASDPRRLTLILVPGVAFARDGHRIGSGQGFFDRFLSPLMETDPRPVIIGIGYGSQLVDALASEPHDVALDGLQLEATSVVCRH